MNKGIYSRGYLPHWDFKESLQAITFRLADSVPNSLVTQWRRELLAEDNERIREQELHRRIARYEDTGHGEVLLARPDCAGILQQQLIQGHAARYRLIEWCIMPNHVHVLIKMNRSSVLGEMVKGWKGASSFQINQLMGRSGSLWQREYHDRLVRDLDHFENCRAYIRNNPVKARLCAAPEAWRFSSAGIDWKVE